MTRTQSGSTLSFMTVDDTAQLRANLEALYASLEQGWSRYGICQARFGDGTGCLGQQMSRILVKNPGQWATEAQREASQAQWEAMAGALGLGDDDAIVAYNDQPERTWQDVKDLVKDAIGRL